jgi:hypothetical protein
MTVLYYRVGARARTLKVNVALLLLLREPLRCLTLT